MAATIAVLAGIATFIAVMWALVVQIFFPSERIGDVSLQIFNPVRDARWVAKAFVPATRPRRQPRARHRYQDIAEDTRRMVAGIGSRS